MSVTLHVETGHAALFHGGKELFRRDLPAGEVARLQAIADRYRDLLKTKDNDPGLLTLGRELFHWLDGDGRDFEKVLDEVEPPLILEIRCLTRRPTPAQSSALHAPWELLADANGFLAQDARLGFSPVRRLQEPRQPEASDDFRLGLTFMASSPRGQHMLDYEAEEAAILHAVRDEDLDLVVEESGDPEQLGHRLAGLANMQILHLSCHGHNAWRSEDEPKAEPRPVLMMEDEEGDDRPTLSEDLLAALGGHGPRLLFLSACLSAALPGAAANSRSASMAAELVQSGLPCVLGWDGSVRDSGATHFARVLYGHLADRKPVERAVGLARRALLNSGDERKRDWHLARVWLGARGGGAIVGGARERSLLPATHGSKGRLGDKDLPVASHEMFVGRRRQLQECLRVLRQKDKSGVLLHGMGRLGKSSLAARLANRRKDLALAVVYGAYDAGSVLAALAEGLKDHPAALEVIKAHRQAVTEDPANLEDALRALILAKGAPCRQDAPVLLVIDDLERILDDPAAPGERHRLQPACAPVLEAVLKVFDPGHTNSRLLLTSRYTFQLKDLEKNLHEKQLSAFSDKEQQKLLVHQLAAAREGGKGRPKLSEEEIKACEPLILRALAVVRGNPGLQDLIVDKLVLSTAVPPEQAEKTIAEMEAWLEGGDLPEEAEIRSFLENLALGTLLDLAGTDGQELLSAALLFDLPVPESVMAALAAQVGGSVRTLRDLGLLEPYEDLVNPAVTAIKVNALAAARLSPPKKEKAAGILAPVLPDLFEAWGGENRQKMPTLTDIELTRLALVARNAQVVAACGPNAVRELIDRAGNRVAAEIGRAALEVCAEQAVEPPLMLLIETSRTLFAIGETREGEDLLARGFALVEQARKSGLPLDSGDEWALIYYYGLLLHRQGDLQGAETRFHELHALATEAGDERGAAIAQGVIADILSARGQFDEALTTYREKVFPALDRLGDVRHVAVCQGKIADILFARGQLDEALKVRQEVQLPVYERLGDVREMAVCQGQIADILFARGQLDEALKVRQEVELPVYERLGDVRSAAITQGQIADILQARGQFTEALKVRQEVELPVYERLGDVRSAAITQGQIADILQARDQLDEALALQGQRLETHKQLQDPKGIAATLWAMAQIELQQGKIQDAADKIPEAYAIFDKLGRLDGIAAIGVTYGQLLIGAGLRDEGFAVLRRSADGFRQLGREQDAARVEALIEEIRKLLAEGEG